MSQPFMGLRLLVHSNVGQIHMVRYVLEELREEGKISATQKLIYSMVDGAMGYCDRAHAIELFINRSKPGELCTGVVFGADVNGSSQSPDYEVVDVMTVTYPELRQAIEAWYRRQSNMPKFLDRNAVECGSNVGKVFKNINGTYYLRGLGSLHKLAVLPQATAKAHGVPMPTRDVLLVASPDEPAMIYDKRWHSLVTTMVAEVGNIEFNINDTAEER